MNCLICRDGVMKEGTGTYFSTRAHCYVIIENVPCHICAQCGEIVYAASVMEKIDEILERIEKVASKIFIMDYRNAA